MMLALLLYAYSMGLRSSRRIEAACRTDAAFRVICGDVVPDHATIARFVVDHEQAIASVFVGVLALCAEAGLASLGTIAIDGTKIGSDAALDANRTGGWIRTEIEAILAEATEADAAEDADPQLFALEQLPEQLSTRAGRLERLDAALARIEAQEAAARAEAEQRTANAREAAAEGRKLPGRKPTDPHAALVRAEADETAVRVRARTRAQARLEATGAARDQAEAGEQVPQAEAEADARVREAVEAHPKVRQAAAATAAARAAADTATATQIKANTTDPESRIMKTATGWIQGYNAQAAVNEHQVVVACEVSQDGNDVGLYQPMVDAVRATLDAAGITAPIGTVLGDAGYWSEANATAAGPDRLIATTKDHKQRRAARELGTTSGDPPEDASPLEAMEHRLRTEQGAAAYATRSHTVEPIFAVKTNRDYRRFRRRGLEPARSEWTLMMTVNNLGKLYRAN